VNINLRGKVALVTGGGSPVGFGKGIALVLAEAGCDIVVNDIDLAGARQTAAEVKALGAKSLAIKADVTQVAEVKKMVEQAIKKFGKIDILVNIWGIPCYKSSVTANDRAEKWKNCQYIFWRRSKRNATMCTLRGLQSGDYCLYQRIVQRSNFCRN
jgi:NAD(P)-dependent dehydrogenase (short-subunit alcohol dehydrogenase family)